MKVATVYSVCECQARLGAELDEKKRVIRGWAKDMRRSQERPAPANSLSPSSARFDIGWFCPFCIRNVLRSFDTSGLAWREVPETTPSTLPVASARAAG
jgi:hypothetical protein